MTLQAVFFDMGGTIETFRWTSESRRRATPGFRKRLMEAGIFFDFTDDQLYDVISTGLDAYHQVSLKNLQELPSARVWTEFIFVNHPVDFKKLAANAESLMLYLETHYYQRIMRPEVPAVLDALKNMGLKIGLISNVNSRGQVSLNLSQYGIRHYFDPIVLSSEYGRRKPDPSIFHYAARLANVPTSKCAYIGDRIARDIVGARRAGFKLAIQIINDFDHGEEDNGAEPDAVITQMTQLLDFIQFEEKEPYSTGRAETRSPNQIQALLFDAGDILYHRPNGNRKFRQFLSEMGIAYREIPEAKRKELRDEAFKGSISQHHYRQAILRLYGVTDPGLLETGCQVMEEDEDGIRFYKGVPETLRTLKEKGYLLGIITDTANPIYIKLSWFERAGFGDVWDSIISSKEIGVEKPDPRMYCAALQQLGLSVQQAVFIGHNQGELDGAHAIGMKTIAFNYEKSTRADYYIKKFEDLLKVVIMSMKN